MDKCDIRVGTSGYSYKDWVGAFYPEGTRDKDMLAFYAERFDTLELNFTYYRMPAAKTLEAMARKTPPGFRFFVKAHGSFTHEGDLSASREFLDALEPLGKKLAGVLFQFPQSFKNTESGRGHLGAIAAAFSSVRVAVEFRDRSWDRDAAYAFLDSNRMAFVCVDEPETSTLFPRVARLTGGFGYLRFHSRDASKWYRGGGDRYDYDYSEAELEEWVPRIQEMSASARELYVFFNNCSRGAAARNAKDFLRVLREAGLIPENPRGDAGTGSLPLFA